MRERISKLVDKEAKLNSKKNEIEATLAKLKEKLSKISKIKDELSEV